LWCVQPAIETTLPHPVDATRAPSLSLSRTPHQHQAPSSSAYTFLIDGAVGPLGCLLSFHQPVACCVCVPEVKLPFVFRGAGCQVGLLCAEAAHGFGGQGDGLGVRHTCSWWGYLQHPFLWLQPGLKGVGVKITLQFQALFEGVTPRVALACSDGCSDWQSLSCNCPGSAPLQLCGGGY
jgi:hypothetical protein